MRGLACAWFEFSLKARRSGLLGEVLRDTVRTWPLRLSEYFVFGTGSVAASTLDAPSMCDGEDGTLGEEFADLAEVVE